MFTGWLDARIWCELEAELSPCVVARVGQVYKIVLATIQYRFMPMPRFLPLSFVPRMLLDM
jgi:hypothetical protein